MLPVLKPYICPRCELAFTLKDSYRGPGSFRVPLLLKCGHSICESCANSIFKVLRNVTCPVCEKITEIERGTSPSTKLLPDVYALGIASANVRQSFPSFKNKQFSSFKPPTQTESDSNALVICDICGRRDGKYRCRKCEDNFCNNCFDSFHRSKSYLKNHVPIPLYVEKYQSLVQEGCPEHDDRPIEFYCDDDNSLACSHCIVTGPHKGHAAVTLIDKNKSCAEDLRTLHDEVSLFCRRLKFTEQKLSQAIPNEKMDSSQWVKLIHSHFHDLHSALFLRESELLKQIDDICNTSVSRIEKLRDEVSRTIKDVDTVLMDATCVLEHPTVSVSVPAILNKLEAVKQSPCHAVPIGDSDDNKDVSVMFEDTLKELITRHGKISADVKPKYTLKGNRDLPPDFIVEPLPPDFSAGDNESVVSDTFSEDSLCVTPNNKVESSELLEKYHHAGKIEKVIVCHIVDPSCFYIRKCSDLKKLADVISKIAKYVRSDNFRSLKANLNEDFYVKGNLYLVQFTNDDQWYRARFIEFIPSSFIIPDGDDSIDDCDKNDKASDEESETDKESDLKAEVYYIDYGNSEIVSVTRMRPMCPELMRFEPLAKKCSLHELVPADSKAWTMSAKRVFQDFVFDKEVNMSVYEERGGILYVDLYQVCIPGLVMDVPASVRDALVFLEHGCFFHEEELSKVKKIRKFRRFLPPERIGANSRVSVNITHIESPSEFYVQQLSSSRLLTELIMEMQKPYADENNVLHAVYSPYVGMICAAQFQNDKMWYRAEVLGLPGGAEVEIEFVDFGYRQVLHHKYLRTIHDSFTKLSRQAVQCSLADVSFSYGTGWSKEATMWLNERIKFKRFSLLSLGYESNSTKTKAVLYDIEDDMEICINALMVEKGMAISTGIYSTRVTKRVERSPKEKAIKSQTSTTSLASCDDDSDLSNPETEKSFNPEPRPEVLPKPSEKLDEHLKVIISHIDSPGSFYIRIAKEEDEKRLENLMKAMQETYHALECSVVDVAIGHDFAAYRESDKKWYRGIIQSVVDDETVMVRFPDYGYIEKIAKKNLRPLLKKFEADSSYAVRCYLSGVIPAGDSRRWSQIATDKFKELAFPHETLYLVNGTTEPSQADTNSLPTDLLYEQIVIGGALEPSTLHYCSITEKLVEHGVAIPIRRKQKFHSSKIVNAPSSVPAEPTKASSPTDSEASAENKEVISSPKKKEATIPKQPKHQWKPPKIPEAMKFSAMPTHVGSDGCIYLQVYPEAVSSATMIKSVLQVKYEGSPFNAGKIAPPVGEAVVAEFELDKKFYRAEIIKSCPRKLQVQFVDYGNFEIVGLDKIHVDPVMIDLPRQCIECELADVHPPNGKWETKILDLIHTRIVEEICTVEVQEPPEEGKRLQVSLDFSVGNLNSMINDIFSVPTVMDNDEDMILNEENQQQENGYLHRYPSPTPLRPGDPFPVCASFIIEPSVVYLQRLKVENPRTQDDLDRNEELSNFLLLIKHLRENAERFPPVTNPVKGCACCAQYTVDDSWYRCIVTDVTAEGVHVRYVDYGNSEVVPLDRLRQPDEMVLAFPIQAHLCKIRGIEPVCGEWTKSVSSALVNVCFRSETELFARFIAKRDINEVELLKQNKDGTFELLYQDLINRGIFTIKY